jgi:hypothetical protein
MSEIRGEYWIQDGQVDFADGDIGDQNHEGIAISAVCHQYSDSIKSLAEDMEINVDKIDHYGEIDSEALSRVLGEIVEKLEETENMTSQQADSHIMTHLGCNIEAYKILQGGGDGRLYAMKYLDWIAVRSNNIELYGYDESKRNYLHSGLNEILDSEGIDEDVPPEEIEFSLYDHKTHRSSYISMADIENPHINMSSNQNFYTTKNPSLPNKSSEENKDQNPQKSVPNNWNLTAQNVGVIGPGQSLWRGTSESWKPFSEWLVIREGR